MKEKFAKLIDVKSIVTFLVIINLLFIVDFVAISGVVLDEKVFLLFSNVVTMIVTYFFAKKQEV